MYPPSPREAAALHVIKSPMFPDNGVPEHVSLRLLSLLVPGVFTTALQFATVVCVPSVTVTAASFVPAKGYAIAVVLDAPESESVPDQEYERLPVPPEAAALQVIVPPAFTEDGLAEHEAIMEPGGFTVAVQFATAVLVPSVTVTEAFFVPTNG